MEDFRRGRDVLTAKAIGRILKNRKDRIAAGLRLGSRVDRASNLTVWSVQEVVAG